MLKLFHSIFGKEVRTATPFPDELILRGIDRALDSTDPRLRVVSGYQRRLRPAVIHAIEHVVHLVQGLGTPVELTRVNYANDACLAALFVSIDHLLEVLREDQSLSAFRRAPGAANAQRVYALLMMQRHEKKVLGVDLRGDVLQREVAQLSVNFTDHRLVDPAADEGECRRMLIRRAFDHLLALALARITQQQERRDILKRRRGLLQRKLELLRSGKWDFSANMREPAPDATEIEARLGEIERELRALPSDSTAFRANLDIVADVLNTAERQLWSTRTHVVVDRMGIVRERASESNLTFDLGELHSADGRMLCLLPVCIPLRELPPPTDLYREAQRYLG